MSIEEQQQEEGKRGRPRDLSRNKVILETTLGLVAENGYESLTIESVAAKAKVGKGTIYRRWSSKTELVIEAAASLMSPIEMEKLDKNQGLRGQLIDLLSHFSQYDDKKYQKAMIAISAAIASNDQFKKEIEQAFYWHHRNAIELIIKPFLMKDAGLTEVEFNLLVDIGPALIVYRSWLRGNYTDQAYVEGIVDTLMMPIIKNKCSR